MDTVTRHKYLIDEKLAIWKALTGHFIAIILTVGLLTIVIMAIIGKVQLSDPTTATFVGTATGYIVSQLARPLSYYFQVDRPSEKSAPPLETPKTENQKTEEKMIT